MNSFRHVLVPVDFSACSEAAFHVAAPLARACGARLSLLYVYPYTPHSGGEAPYVAAPLEQDARASVVQKLHALARSSDGGAASVATIVRDGDAVSEILALAEGQDVDLIVVGRHGHGGLDRLLLGSVSAQVAQRALCSVLVVREAGTAPPTSANVSHVFCGVDLAPSSFATAATAAAVARALGARLTVHHSVQPWHWEDPWPIARGDERLVRQALSDSAHSRLADLIARVARPGEDARGLVTFGHAGPEVVREAQARGADLLVVGAHPTTLVGRVFLGSATRHAVRAMPCPILLVRPTAVERADQPALATAAAI
jgi:nucleotide-binding universal stress UspA family protein